MMMERRSWVLLAALTLTLGLPDRAAAVHGCPADLNGSGQVDGIDLGILLGAWGTSFPAADFDGDGVVGCFDREYLLGNWGPCPCFGDLDGNQVVDGVDLGILLGSFGNDCQTNLDQNGTVGEYDREALFCLWETPGPLGDFSGDGIVNGIDLGILLGDWGTDCRGDLDHDGTIGDDDLDLLLGAWGRCS
jgi:hypothetical protein